MGQVADISGDGRICREFYFVAFRSRQNGFFFWTEWIPVFSSAIAIGFLLVIFVGRVSRRVLDLTLAVMFVQVIVGSVGFYFHGVAVSSGADSSFFENLISTAPIFAPLLFVNLAFLSGVGIWDARSKLSQSEL